MGERERRGYDRPRPAGGPRSGGFGFRAGDDRGVERAPGPRPTGPRPRPRPGDQRTGDWRGDGPRPEGPPGAPPFRARRGPRPPDTRPGTPPADAWRRGPEPEPGRRRPEQTPWRRRPEPHHRQLAELLAPDEELIAGRRPVEEAFVARRDAIRLLVVPQRRQALERLVLHATSLRIPVVEVEGGTLTAISGFDGHQGIAVVVPPRRFATLEEIRARAIERGEPPFVLALDSLEDPQNVGTLLRSAEAAGVHGVVFPTSRQAPLTPAAIKASAGAVEHLLLCPVDDLPGALADLHIQGLRIVGAEAEAPLTAREADLRGPLTVVVGSEGHGLGPAVRRRCDLLVRIPMRGAIGSLNAAVAGSILLFEAAGQRPERRPEPAAPEPAAPEPAAPEPAAPEPAAPEPAAPEPASAAAPAEEDGDEDLLPGGPQPPAPAPSEPARDTPTDGSPGAGAPSEP